MVSQVWLLAALHLALISALPPNRHGITARQEVNSSVTIGVVVVVNEDLSPASSNGANLNTTSVFGESTSINNWVTISLNGNGSPIAGGMNATQISTVANSSSSVVTTSLTGQLPEGSVIAPTSFTAPMSSTILGGDSQGQTLISSTSPSGEVTSAYSTLPSNQSVSTVTVTITIGATAATTGSDNGSTCPNFTASTFTGA